MKTLKFTKSHIPLMLSGEKTTTWRLFDDKNLKEGEEITCLNSETKELFAKVLIINVKEKTFRELTEEDKRGHEGFENNEEMLKIYSGYYNIEVTLDTPLKIIKFKVIG